ncbi:MAG: Holliday junction resolvase RuvX [Clostridia bacterium]|nr:Holliday junction resolvase RuvX [Clostridia bacterium]
MRIMGLDVGDKKIGVAISDSLLITAQGKETLFRESLKVDLDKLIHYINEYDVHKIVVGMPLNMNGSLGPQGEKTKQFVAKLEKKLIHSTRIDREIEIVYWDERLTTMGATRSLIETDMSRKKRKGVVDTVAAVLILQGYLDGNRTV